MQAVIFDFFGVVAKPRNISNTIAKFAKRDLEDVIPLYEQYEAGHISCESFWNHLGLKKYQIVEKKLAKTFTIDLDFKPVHAELKKSYATALLSNSDSHLLHALLKQFNLEDTFEAVVISQDVHLRKPDPRIFRKLLASLNMNPEECVFVDDRLHNLKTAKELGMTTVFHSIEPEEEPGFKPDFTINELTELLDVMEELD